MVLVVEEASGAAGVVVVELVVSGADVAGVVVVVLEEVVSGADVAGAVVVVVVVELSVVGGVIASPEAGAIAVLASATCCVVGTFASVVVGVVASAIVWVVVVPVVVSFSADFAVSFWHAEMLSKQMLAMAVKSSCLRMLISYDLKFIQYPNPVKSKNPRAGRGERL